MCLTIPQNPAFNKPVKALPVYKAYGYNTAIVDNKEALLIKPIYQGKNFILRNGIIIVSNRGTNFVSSAEVSYGRIEQGLHGFSTKKSAVELAAQSGSKIILKFEGRPAEFICKGTNGDVVYNKLNFVSIVGTTNAYGEFTAYDGRFDKHLVGPVEVNV